MLAYVWCVSSDLVRMFSLFCVLSIWSQCIKPKQCFMFRVFVFVFVLYVHIYIFILLLSLLFCVRFYLRVCVWCVYVYARVFHFISALFVRPVTAKHMCSIDMRFNNTVSWFLSSSSFFSLHSDVVVVLKVVCVCISYGTEICVRFQVCSKHTGEIVRASKKWHDRTNERMSGISVA